MDVGDGVKIIYGKFSTILDENGKEIFRCIDYGIKRTGPCSIEGFRMIESIGEPEYDLSLRKASTSR